MLIYTSWESSPNCVLDIQTEVQHREGLIHNMSQILHWCKQHTDLKQFMIWSYISAGLSGPPTRIALDPKDRTFPVSHQPFSELPGNVDEFSPLTLSRLSSRWAEIWCNLFLSQKQMQMSMGKKRPLIPRWALRSLICLPKIYCSSRVYSKWPQNVYRGDHRRCSDYCLQN